MTISEALVHMMKANGWGYRRLAYRLGQNSTGNVTRIHSTNEAFAGNFARIAAVCGFDLVISDPNTEDMYRVGIDLPDCLTPTGALHHMRETAGVTVSVLADALGVKGRSICGDLTQIDCRMSRLIAVAEVCRFEVGIRKRPYGLAIPLTLPDPNAKKTLPPLGSRLTIGGK